MRNRPEVVVLCGISLDGKMNIKRGVSSKVVFDQNIPDDVRDPLRKLRMQSDAVLVGINTVISDNPTLLSNENESLVKIVVDSSLRIPLNSNLVVKKPHTTLIATTERCDRNKLNILKEKGVEIVFFGKNKVDLQKLFSFLYINKKINKILVEGGGTIIYTLFREKLIDKIGVVIFPFIIGNKNAISLVEGNGFQNHDIIKLTLEELKVKSMNYVFLTYKINYGERR